jgi:nicotinamidase-related amidase
MFNHLPASQKTDSVKTVLLLIDIQNFYFPGGRLPLLNPEKASLNAQRLLKYFRKEKNLVVHIRHNSKSGGEIHKNVEPLPDEKVISKNHANAFRDTDLLDFLKKNKIDRLVICGMMTHMCVEAATRAGHDYGFECVVIQDACSTRDLKFNNKIIKADEVHYSTLSSLSGYYAKVMDLELFLENDQ